MISNKTICEHQLKKNEKYMIPFGKVKITVYAHSPLLINVTGCKSMQEVKHTQNCIEIAYNIQCLYLTIDNIQLSIMGCKSINQVKEYKTFIINLLNHFVK